MWNFLSGYVMIQAEGKNLERFLNLMLAQKLEISNASRCKANAVQFEIAAFDFYRLRSLIKKNRLHIKIKILKKYGLFVHLLALRQRKVLLCGWILVAVAIALLSRRIWIIDINGCDVIDEHEVLAVLEEWGISRGTPKTDFATALLGRELMSVDERIAWAGVNISGVILSVDIKEAQEIILPETDCAYASIYAGASGKIKRITALMGKPCVKAGDIVSAGDILISGDLSSEKAANIFVCSRGEVIAEVVQTFSAVAPVMQKTFIRTGEYEEVPNIKLFGAEFCSRHTEYAHFEDEYRTSVKLENCVLPLTVENMRRYELEEVYLEADTMTLREKAKKEAQTLMENGVSKDAVIISKKTSVQTLDDGSVQATVVVTTEQNIAKTRNFEWKTNDLTE